MTAAPAEEGFVMSGRRTIVILVALLVGGLAGCGGDGGGDATDVVPAIAVRSLTDESQFDLAAYRGTPTVLNFWAPWCPPCRQEMPDFDSVAAARSDEVHIVGVATGTEEAAAKEFADQIGVSYDLVYDVDDVALSDLGISGLPATLFLDADGRVVDSVSGMLSATDLDARIDALLAT
ncbi:MAG: TlpA disulfide reductase family protein [Ilumatobacteraceae bacterium]